MSAPAAGEAGPREDGGTRGHIMAGEADDDVGEAFRHLRLNPSHAARPLPANSKTPTASTNAAELFLKSACNFTTYPDLCISSLSSYSSSINNSPMLLAHTALSVSLDGARSASTAMRSMSTAGGRMSPREAGAMRDCVENVGDSIDELRDSLSEMGTLRMGKDLTYKINSIQTWVSAALTDDNSCMEGFGENRMDESVKATVRGPIVNVAHLTSNALALINALMSSTNHSSTVAPLSTKNLLEGTEGFQRLDHELDELDELQEGGDRKLVTDRFDRLDLNESSRGRGLELKWIEGSAGRA
ncbi:hypothetical protein IEQ34_006220 [Dendrobium chrysotoxum]|uniref:Pectinesterase inhibitor domain-containing protein n=1 Tax=Dendrobium chrysotoxum TaxID=161865 RepID=A0AAV7HCA1_DENCH|nr:hypothetical protein IEQ34_006220 [Dendrobium chrysotoxum]